MMILSFVESEGVVAAGRVATCCWSKVGYQMRLIIEREVILAAGWKHGRVPDQAWEPRTQVF